MSNPAHQSSRQMRLPGCYELESGVPAPGSLWARTSDDLPFGKVPLLNGSFQPVWSSPATKQLGGSDMSRSIRPTASPNDASPAIMTPSANYLPVEPSSALLFSSLPPPQPRYIESPPLDKQPAGILLPYKYKKSNQDTPYASSISLWSPPSSASTSGTGLPSGPPSQVYSSCRESPAFFASPPTVFTSPPHNARDAINHTSTTPPLGRLHPVDPSWCTEAEQPGPWIRHPSSNSSPAGGEQHGDIDTHEEYEEEDLGVQRKRKRAPGRGKPEGAAHTTALDNDPPPFNLDKQSYTILKEHLWISDGVMPSSFHCRWHGCNQRVSTGESQIPTHYTDVHDLAPGSSRVRCHWVDSEGKVCTAHTSFHNYRLHVLDVHLRANVGRCKICHHNMTNSGGMKRHLKRCLRPRTVEEMWQRYGVHVVLPQPGVEGAQGHCYIPAR